VKVTLSVKLKLTANQKSALDRVTLAYRDAMNYTSEVAFTELDRTSSANKMHKVVYPVLRKRFKLPWQMACSVSWYVGATYETQWTKLKKHAEQQKFRAGVNPNHRFRSYRGLDAAPKFVSRTLTYQSGKDYTFKKNQQVSVLTLEGRVTLSYGGWSKHLDYLEQGADIGAGKLWYSKQKKQYHLLVALEIDIPDIQPFAHVVGVDVGQRCHLVAQDNQGGSMFASGRDTNQKKDGFSRVKTSLQRKGTRSATRRLIAFSGRERRFIADRNHVLALQLLNRFPSSLIGLEDLTDIRDRTEGRNNPKASKRARRNKRRCSLWSFAELQTFVAYKAPSVGSMAIQVSAAYTSQCCPKCGHCSKGNRPNAGLMFVCEICGIEAHGDLVTARNINLRTLFVRQDWMSTGALSVRPNVSGGEAKAERLKRYLALRWSPDTSLRLSVAGH
jgi:putative transposase